jgi:hypothetical protein
VGWIEFKDVDCAVPDLTIGKVQMDLLHMTKGCPPAAAKLDRTRQPVR